MRKSSYDKFNNNATKQRNILTSNNTSYVLTSNNSNNLKNVNQKYISSFQSCYENLQDKSYLQRSISADNVIRSRGFKPSDRHDPVKRNFLENLTSKILHFDMESGERTPMNLQKLLTPASDSQTTLHAKNKKMFASSYFYAPTHPTVEDQVELARRISLSLSDVKNMKSKGQSMYVNRKKRSVKWIHDGNGTEGEEEPSSPMHKDKVPLKCVMNPHGKVLDIHGIQALGEEVNIEPMPSHPEKLFDIVRDLNNQRGRGAEIFAKRRKRSEKWVVDQDQVKTPSTPSGVTKIPPSYPYQSEMNGNGKYSTLQSPYQQTDKSIYNPFAVDLSLDNINSPVTDRHRSCQLTNDCNHSTQIQKIYLREVAVGTDTDFPTIENKYYESNKKQDVVVRRGNGFISNGVKSNNNNNNNNVVNNVERRFNKLLGNKTNSNNATQISNTNNKEMKILINNNSSNGNSISNKNKNKNKNNNNREIIKQRLGNHFSQENFINDRTNKFWNKSQAIKHDRDDIERLSDSDDDDDDDDDAAANEYTPVPVKQLIQEFEKTCRPVLQYKQISPKVIPIVKQCPIDTDIARFFQTRTNVKYNEQVPRDDMEEEEEEDEEEDDDDDDDDDDEED
ncbi:probable serine/threonine-protein kinase tsuA, partial [Polistes fuscatus]|uniref:probable serine/threonine-protein kinase tsuA n=1 Tax=Polistes fuscatus TaxID=30207 RepID=UPI001CA8E58D